jgi:hypothetical protein
MFILNTTQSEKVYSGATFPIGVFTEVQNNIKTKIQENELLIQDIVSGEAIISFDGLSYSTDINTQINILKDFSILQNVQDEAISSNVLTKEGKVLYAKIHGVKENVTSGSTHIFEFEIPYTEIYFFGAEVMQDIIGVADYDIAHPLAGVLEQYGYDVNLGTIKYKRETKFGARLPQGLIMRCHYKNDTTETQEVGINFLMHEIRDV